MQSKARMIENGYRRLESSMLKQGRLPMRDTGVGYFNGSIIADVFGLFHKINLGAYRNFVDLGSGDGRIVLLASLFTNAVGIEADRDLVDLSLRMKSELGIRNADFIHKNFYEHDISGHDIVFISPDAPMHRGLEGKLFRELRGHALVVSHHFHPQFLKRIGSHWVNGSYGGLYSL